LENNSNYNYFYIVGIHVLTFFVKGETKKQASLEI